MVQFMDSGNRVVGSQFVAGTKSPVSTERHTARVKMRPTPQVTEHWEGAE